MPKQPEVKKRKVMARDLETIAERIKSEKGSRERSKWRKRHIPIWDDIERQIRMEAEQPIARDNSKPSDWHSALQLGDLADAAELMTDDVMADLFPLERQWFRAHTQIKPAIGDEPNSASPTNVDLQRENDNMLRSLMVQQHKDFGFRERIKDGVREVMTHGGVVIETIWHAQPRYHDGTRIERIEAPVPKVHSIRNCYPDESPQVHPADLFYQGSMIIEEWMAYGSAIRMPNWKRKSEINRCYVREKGKEPVPEDHIEILHWHGDMTLERDDGIIFWPNMHFITASGALVYWEGNDLPYSRIIYTGYERDDVRDPYYTSPIMKRAPMAKFVTRMANMATDAIDLNTEPPGTYDSIDPQLQQQGGPAYHPGAMTPAKGGAGVNFFDVPDPQWALAAMSMGKEDVRRGTTSNPKRSAVSPGTELTATEVVKEEERDELRLVEFGIQFSDQGLTPFLYMQHALNKKKLDSYPFYNSADLTRDFLRYSKSDLPDAAHFNVTGVQEIREERQRIVAVSNTATGIAGVPQAAAETNWREVTKELWSQTGAKNTQRFLRDAQSGVPMEQVQAFQQQAQQTLQQLQAQLAEAQEKLGQTALQAEAFKAEKSRLQADINSLQEQLRIERDLTRAKEELRAIQEQIRSEIQRSENQAAQERTEEAEGEARESDQRLEAVTGQIAEITSKLDELGKNVVDMEAAKREHNQAILSVIQSRRSEG